MGTPVSAANFAQQLSSPAGLRVPGKNASAKEIKDVALQLEGVFFSLFVKEMRKTMTDGSLFGEGPGAETYEGFFDQMMGESLGQSGGLGIAEMVVRNAMRNRNRTTIEDLQGSLTETRNERITGEEPVDQGRETNERTGSKET